MAASNANLSPGVLLLATLFTAPAAWCAAHAPAVQPITLDAQSLDGTQSSLLFRKVRIAQGTMSIAADTGQSLGQAADKSSRLAFDDSVWTFRGDVKITMNQGLLTADDAEIKFLKQQLSTAVANGKPALFEEHIERTGKLARGHADTIDYDAGKGVVRLLKNAWLSDGQTEIRGESLKYNVVAQSIVADGAEQDAQRVHIVITPPPAKP